MHAYILYIGNSLSTTTNWVSNLIVSSTFLYIVDLFTPAGAFFLYGFAALFSGTLFYFILPETKGKPYPKIKEAFESGWIQNQN